eukprot:3317463-Alexandrium_andersonii.AAC.1
MCIRDRVSRESVDAHRNPVFSRELGTSIGSMRVDSVHTLNLGAMLVFCRVSLWHFWTSTYTSWQAASATGWRSVIFASATTAWRITLSTS